MLYDLSRGQIVSIAVNAKDFYSSNKLKVSEDQEYEITCDKVEKWTDWFYQTDANGFFNLFASIAGLRVKKAKCFCLCSAYNDNDLNAFAIGAFKRIMISFQGTLSFFANDAMHGYGNNKGSLNINVCRIM